MIRFTVDGTEYTVDTAKEAAELRKLLGRQRSAKKAASARWAGPPPPVDHLLNVAPINRVFSALYGSAHGKLESSKLAEALKVRPGAIPPLFAHARAWLRHTAPQETFDGLIRRDMDADGNTVFALTAEGCEFVRKMKEGKT